MNAAMWAEAQELMEEAEGIRKQSENAGTIEEREILMEAFEEIFSAAQQQVMLASETDPDPES